ncbi:MAG: biotin/lipoate A/B protein ligase family protein [Limisphaerales bacterium]
MNLLDRTWPTPAENLACDEALLDACEGGAPGRGEGVLRLHEPESHCVVVGYGNRVAAEVDQGACEAAGVPILRRTSGGGTVVLGPGCLAYTLVLPISAAPELATVTGTNRWVMERNRSILESVLGRSVAVRGFTDLTVGDFKFSGNAQRRRRNVVLFHGTFLLAMDLGRISGLLKRPSWEPEYRRGRSHGEFVVNLGVPSDAVREGMMRGWGVSGAWEAPLEGMISERVRERFGRPEWNLRL